MGTLVGQTVGNYNVVSVIGSGAMGEVYLAEHPQIGRRVAVKIMVPQYSANADVAARFMSEARAVNKINHPNIIQIFDFGTLQDGRLYYTMEYLEGVPLTNLVKDRAPVSLREAEELVHQIADALDAAHAVGIVHRDLKPDNIFVKESANGRFLKVLDFGIAKLLDDGVGSQHRTSTGMIMGTPLYMAPEQAAGQTNLISPRTDIYALGVITYQLLSAHLPIEAPTTAQVLAKHITDLPTPLGDVAHGLPPAVCAVVEAALAKDPAQRPQSAGQFFMGFRQACTGADLDALPTTIDQPARTGGSASAGAYRSNLATQPTTLGSTASQAMASTGGGMGLEQRRSRAPLFIALAAVLAVGGGVGGYLALRPSGDKGKSPPAAAQGGEDMKVEMAPEPVMAAEPMASGMKVYAVSVSSKTEKVKVEVTVSGQPPFVKTAPFKFDVKEGERVSLKATRDGYQEQVENLLATADKTIEFDLERRRSSGSGSSGMTPPRPEPRRTGEPEMRPRPPGMSSVGEGTLKPVF
jgi:serine/threonine-protein kinase